jgi:tetratricopeptide (TPR) repeat protein
MTFRRILSSFAVMAGIVLTGVTVDAEQIRLSDGRIIQGEMVGQPTDQGFTFRLTQTGGQAFFRWSQINPDDEARLRNIRDPDAGIQLIVYIPGDRLNLEFGEPIEGKVDRMADHWLVTNARYRSGRRVPLDEVDEREPVQRGVMIDARVMHRPPKVLELYEAANEAESAHDWYVAARIAEHMGLLAEAKERLDRCLDMGPTSLLLATAEQMRMRLEELIKQEAVLKLMAEVRDVADSGAYALAIQMLDNTLKTAKPTGAIKDALDNLKVDIDREYTDWVIKELHSFASSAARSWVREKAGRGSQTTVVEAMTYARRPMHLDVLREMATLARGVGSPEELADATLTADINNRFRLRLTEEDRIKRLKNRSANFTRDGWYQAVGGNLPNAGKRRSDPAPGQGQQPPRFPRGADGSRPPGAGGGGGGGGRGIPWEDGFGGFQDAPPEGGEGGGGQGEIDPDAIAEVIERFRRNQERAEQPPVTQEGGPRGPSRAYEPNDPNMRVPEIVPSHQEWWERLGTSARIRFLLAVYARDSRTMDIVSENYYRFTYR